MGIRVRVTIRRPDVSVVVEASALLNSGFESGDEEILLPPRLAQRLGFLPDLPAATTTEEYHAVGGVVLLHRIPDAVIVGVPDAPPGHPTVPCTAVISPTETEAILNDAAISALRIEPADPRGGRWRFVGESGLRQGLPPGVG